MCGIAGYVSARPIELANEQVLESLRHRGPDGEGGQSREGEGWGWGIFHTRLAIVDLSRSGAQPISNESGSLWLSFNGEIYNHGELRMYCESRGHSFRSGMDGEVILHLWEEEGTSALNRLNGIYAFCLADTESGEVVLARDPLGVKPLYYCRASSGSLWFASEIKSLITAEAPVGGPDPLALAQFLTFLWIPAPRTPYEHVRSLQPGEMLTWTRSEIRKRRFYNLGDRRVEARSDREVITEATERLRRAAQRQTMADVPIGLMASGGVDSSLIWWATREQLSAVFTIDWPRQSGEERLYEDAQAVRTLTRRFKTTTHVLDGTRAELDHLPGSGDLFADPAYGLTRLIAADANARGYKVLLSGQGGDELLGGYRRHLVAQLLGKVDGRLSATALRAVRSILPRTGLKSEYAARVTRALGETDPFEGYMQLCTYSSAEERAKALDTCVEDVTNAKVWETHRATYEALPEGRSFLRKVTLLDLQVYLPGLGLSYVDRGGMEFGVEVRVPWLDMELVEWTLGLPDRFLIRNGKTKWLSKQVAAHVLTKEVAHRPKRGFAAPTPQAPETTERGYRQANYFSTARRMVYRFLHDARPDSPP